MDGLKAFEGSHASKEVQKVAPVKQEDKHKTEKKQAEENKKRLSDLDLTEIQKKFDTSINNSSIQFDVARDDGRTVIEIKDRQSGEVIRKIPNEETLRIAKNIDDFIEIHNEKGLALDNKA